MSTPDDLVEQQRRRQRRRRWALLLALPVLAYGVAYLLTYTDRYERLPSSVWRSGDPARIAEAGSGDGGEALDRGGGGKAGGSLRPLEEPPQALKKASTQWVQAINESNPGAIRYHEVDTFGNLYVVLGAWWVDMTVDQQTQVLDQLGRYWRTYLFDIAGRWRGPEGRSDFAPGIVVVDRRGHVAHNLNGQVVIERRAAY